MDIQNRLKMVLRMHNLTPSAFADQIGVQRSNVSHVLSGRNKPGLDFLEKILLNFPRVNANWLITGRIEEKTDIYPIQDDEARTQYDAEPDNNSVIHNPFSDNEDLGRIVLFYKNGTFETFRNK